MKINYKKSILCVILILAVIMIFSPKSQAAALVINFSKSTANVGDTVTVTITGQGLAGRADLTVSGPATLSENTIWVDNNSASVTAKITGEGSVKITATPTSMAENSATADPYTQPTAGTITVVSTSPSGGSSSSGSGSSSGSSSSGSTSGSSTTTTPEKESSNANLSNLGIRPNDFSGFTPGTTTYNVTVPEDVESVEVYATAQDSRATISGTGNKTLAYGENALSVVVTAEDGTTKTYTINVTREGEEETEETEGTETVNGLSNITIGDLELSPSFKTDVYAYTVKYTGEDTSLDIQTVATDPSYTVEILGNEELKEGENTITILVSDSEGNNVATYQLTVNKSLVDEEALAREEEERQQQEQRRMLIIAGGIIVLILIIVIIIVIKRRKNRAYAEEFSGVPFAGLNDEDYNEYDNYDNYDSYDNDNQFDNYNNMPVNEESSSLQEENHKETSPVEENSTDENQVTSKKIEFDDKEEKREKEKAKRDFLEGYNSDYTDEYEENKPRRGRKKGKRFK